MLDQFINVSNVTYQYKSEKGSIEVLNKLDFEVGEGGFTAIVGPSGCGKSTLSKLISGLLTPSDGEIFLQGEKVTSPRANVGMAFQNPVMLEWRTVINNVTLPLEIVSPSMKAKEKEDRARYLLALVGLEGFENKRPSELSGGMRQRVSLCRALVHQPEVLILDEPFAALDAFTREDLWQVMHKLKEKEPFTGILITHDLRESIFLADEVIVLSNRPASVQYLLKVNLAIERTIDNLFTPKAIEMLNILREQIRIAQKR